jgi:multidrug efflux pump subunit AcrA (membrane-fusion protein)
MMGADDGAVSSATAIDGQGHTIPLTYIGRAPTLRQQSLPMLFRVEDPHASLAIGATVRVLVQKGTPVEGIIVPDGAVVRSTNGLPQVWIKMAPETFEPRAVRTSPLDGGSVLVTDGLAKGDRVVVQGAELINQIR